MKTLAGIVYGNMKDPDESKRGKVGIVDMPIPEMDDYSVKVKVAYCSICGSDPHTVGGAFGYFDAEHPKGLGHEVSGVIVELGKKATTKGFKIGDRVAGNFIHYCGSCYYCQNGQQQFCTNNRNYRCAGMAEYVVWHEDQLYKLPESVSLKEGCLLEPASVVVRMMDKCMPKIGMRIAVCGGGPIGQLALQCLNIYGATDLTMIEPIADRRDLAKKYGAVHVIDPVNQSVEEEGMRITNGMGYDIVLDASGSPHAVESLLKIAAYGGKIVYGAMYPTGYKLPLDMDQYLYRKELTITGSLVSPYAYPRATQLLTRLQLEDFTTAVYDLDHGADAFAMHLTGKYPKVLIHCNPDLD
jgi:L-iditol 2-dehydrogenase